MELSRDGRPPGASDYPLKESNHQSPQRVRRRNREALASLCGIVGVAVQIVDNPIMVSIADILPVAILINPIAKDLWRSWIDSRIAIVAIDVGRDPVLVGVATTLIDPVSVLVDSIALDFASGPSLSCNFSSAGQISVTGSTDFTTHAVNWVTAQFCNFEIC
jgi:hypothetical protein